MFHYVSTFFKFEPLTLVKAWGPETIAVISFSASVSGERKGYAGGA